MYVRGVHICISSTSINIFLCGRGRGKQRDGIEGGVCLSPLSRAEPWRYRRLELVSHPVALRLGVEVPELDAHRTRVSALEMPCELANAEASHASKPTPAVVDGPVVPILSL